MTTAGGPAVVRLWRGRLGPGAQWGWTVFGLSMFRVLTWFGTVLDFR